MQDELATTPATAPADAMPVTDPGMDASAAASMSAGEAVPPADPASLDVSSALPEGMDRLDLLMGNTDSLALTKMGFAHLVQLADVVGLMAFTVMAVMSVLVWYYVLYNFLRLAVVRSRADRVITAFWESGSPREAMSFLRAQPELEPFSKIAIDAAFASEHHSDALGGRMAEALSRHEFIDRAVRSAITRESHRFDSGLTLLASVGSTAPFVGLFGTVWGIYHALINIGATGEATLDVVAGPVGEALIMTCIGLGVAIPSVLAYNYFVRSNKAMLARFNAFGHDLLDYFATGARVRTQRFGTKQHVPSAG